MTTATPTRVSIPFFNYRSAFAAKEDEFLVVIQDVLRRGAFIQQRDLADFEADLARYLGVKFAFGVANATDGLIMALRAASIGPGDEVLFPSHTMVASAAAIAHVGGVPVPVDCADDHLIDPEALLSAITSNTRGIIPVHLNGRTCRMDVIERIAEEHQLVIVEDAAQALGSQFRGRPAGTFGKAGVFSFYPAKLLGCFGDGGAVVTNDPAVARKIALLRDHGRNNTGDVECWGFNSRLDNMQAAVLALQFKDYEAIVDRRRAVAALYQDMLGDLSTLRLPPAPGADPDHFDVYQNYEIEASNRDDLRAYLNQHGVGTIIQWGGKAVHQFAKLGFKSSLPRTEELFRHALLLPLNMVITNAEVRIVGNLIRAFYGYAHIQAH